MSATIHHETLWAAFDAARSTLTTRRAVSSEFDSFMHTGGIPYGANWTRSFALDRLQGRFTRQAFHVSIFRSERGLYEVTTYIL